jgi:integrase
MRAKVTRRTLDAAKGVAQVQRLVETWVWDTQVRGFYARFRMGDRSGWRYFVKYHTAPGRGRHHAVGEDGESIPPESAERLGLTPGAAWSPETARKEAERIRGLVRNGLDPDAGREIPTLLSFAERFMREHMSEPLRKAQTVASYRRLLDRHLLPALGDYRLDRLDRAAVQRFAQEHKKTPIAANRSLAVLSSIYNRAVAWGVVDASINPARGIPRFRENRRERFLSADELARLGAALRELETAGEVSLFGLAAIRVLLFTGARPSEITGLRWEQVDLERGVLSLPDSKTGKKVIYLNPPARKVLVSLPRLEGDPRVFPSRQRRAARPDLDSAWRAVRERAKLDGVRLYDASRHSFASIAVAGGASLYLVGGLLGHAKPQTTQRYAHLSADPLRAVNDAVGERIAAAMRPARKAAKVEPMRRPRGR